ncbi:hypothetical protein C5167_006188, partial [Papaver somniferum]
SKRSPRLPRSILDSNLFLLFLLALYFNEIYTLLCFWSGGISILSQPPPTITNTSKKKKAKGENFVSAELIDDGGAKQQDLMIIHSGYRQILPAVYLFPR